MAQSRGIVTVKPTIASSTFVTENQQYPEKSKHRVQNNYEVDLQEDYHEQEHESYVDNDGHHDEDNHDIEYDSSEYHSDNQDDSHDSYEH